MTEALLCFPHQLFETSYLLEKIRKVFLVEDSLFFGDAHYPTNFHKKKLVFHRASMKYYEDYLIKRNFSVTYLDYDKKYGLNVNLSSVSNLIKQVKTQNIKKVYVFNPVDWALERRIRKEAKKKGLNLVIEDTPAFKNKKSYVMDFFLNKKTYRQTSFYIAQRKRWKILIKNNKPLGGKWTFDRENRKKIPKNLDIPKIPKITTKNYVKEAINYVENKFPDNPGKLEDFIYPITHQDAKMWFKKFLEERFNFFGPYEDALTVNDSVLFHSLLSPLLNCGLLNPDLVIKTSVEYAKKNNIPLNSLEGFVRQILGWREFIRAIYILEGVKQRNSNHLNHKNPIPSSFYDGTTSILPVDNVIKRLIKDAYLNHIERLMILGNFMNLCEIDPNMIYQWFMELFIDAYDWVMVPNVYGMSLYADGGLITTKPYVSSSNYIMKMSNYTKGDWCEIWDGLYWRFIYKHQDEFRKNPRMSMMVNLLNRMSKAKLKKHIEIAEKYLKKLFK